MNEVPGRLLRETLLARTASASAACLDAETVASWADGALSPHERSAVEAHAADCARCRALLAALARASPPAAARSWWRLPRGAWVAPLAAAAAVVLVVWMNVPRRAALPPGDRAASVSIAATAPVPPSASTPRERLQKPALTDQIAAAKRVEQAESARASGGLRQNDSLENTVSEPSRARRLDAGVSAPASPSAPRGSAAASAPERSATDSAPASMPRAASRAQSAPNVAAEQATLFDVLRRQAVIVSSTSASRWRIVPGGTVQHSTDGGSTWEAQSTGVAVTLTAGVSPSPSICWLVGPGGAVLRSTDGRSWQRLAFPEAADLASVSATDDKAATVTTSDGRTFSTNDGGRTWAH